MFSPRHFGLYFTEAHVKTARDNRDAAPFEDAWKLLREHEETGVQAAQWLGFRYRFLDDTPAGEAAVQRLGDFFDNGLMPDMTYIDALRETLIQVHAVELVRDHPAMAPELANFLRLVAERIQYLNQLEYERSYVEAVLLGQVNLVGGIVLENAELYQSGVDVYEMVVREDIHPQGYIEPAVAAHDGGGLLRQIIVVSALVQMAEAAQHVGGALWDYSFRGVSVMTGFSYLLYYYFYPEKWRWDDAVTNEPFKEYNGFLEMVNHRAYPKDLKPILDELRPIYDPRGGGFTTLSHGMTGRPKRRLFG